MIGFSDVKTLFRLAGVAECERNLTSGEKVTLKRLYDQCDDEQRQELFDEENMVTGIIRNIDLGTTKVQELQYKASLAVKLIEEVMDGYSSVRTGNEQTCGFIDVFGETIIAHAKHLRDSVNDMK